MFTVGLPIFYDLNNNVPSFSSLVYILFGLRLIKYIRHQINFRIIAGNHIFKYYESMTIKIFSPDDDVSKIEGFTVVVDVFRAFSTSYFISENNPKIYLLSDSVVKSLTLKNELNDVILIGERNGRKLESFDFGNSPYEVSGHDFTENTVIHTTTHGTRGVIVQPSANEVVVGSFVCMQAIINYINTNKINTVNIYCSAKNNIEYGKEDYIFAEYFKARLSGESCSFEEVLSTLRDGPGQVFVKEIFAPYIDFLMCMDINKFDFILKRKIDGDNIQLEQI